MIAPAIGTAGRFTVFGVSILGASPQVDIDIEDGKIIGINPRSGHSSRQFVALPGLVDLHSHLREPGGENSETIASGTRAAAAGGYTDVFAMANTHPVTDTADRVAAIRAKSIAASARVHPVAAATLGLAGARLTDVKALRAAGITVFSDDGHCVNDDGLVHELLTTLAKTGGTFAQHAQSEKIVGKGVINERVAASIGCGGWPPAGEEAIVARDIAIARATGGRLHVCHVSTRRTVELIRWAKSMSAPVTAEVTPHHLTLTDAAAVSRGPALKVNPPLRSNDDVRALREALRDGTIDVIGTDHAPHPSEMKSRGWMQAAFGLTGIETAFPIVADILTDSKTGDVDWVRLVEVMSATPAEIGDIRNVAGKAIEVGAEATFCIAETGGSWKIDAFEHFSKSRNTPFQGMVVRQRVAATVLNGRVTHSIG